MGIRYPIEYELTPDSVDKGSRWLTVSLKNIGNDDLTMLDVKLNSLDVYSIAVLGTGSYVAALKPDEFKTLPFQISANSSGSLYISVDGWQDGDPFHWESPALRLKVGREVAEITSLFALTEPYPLLGENIRCEATLHGLAESQGLSLEFWAAAPSGDFQELADIETKTLDEGETVSYAAEITPEETGLYTIYAYLYDGVRRLGRETEYVYVRQA